MSTLVALRKPDDFGPPPRDGLVLRAVGSHQPQKAYYLHRYANSASLATKDGPFRGARTYVEPFAASGICIDKDTGELSWGSALTALQVSAPYDTYILNDIDPAATVALAQRARALGIPYAAVFELDIGALGAFSLAREIQRTTCLGPKIVVTTGDANDLPQFVKILQPQQKWRYILAVIDPTSAMFKWRALELLAYTEKAMDVLSLFPDSIDLARGMAYYLNSPASGRKLDAYFGDPGWREIVRNNPMHCEHDLLRFYESRMTKMLSMLIGQPKAVGKTQRALYYHLIFGSKHQLGIDLWNRVNSRAWNGQDELFLPGV